MFESNLKRKSTQQLSSVMERFAISVSMMHKRRRSRIDKTKKSNKVNLSSQNCYYDIGRRLSC